MTCKICHKTYNEKEAQKLLAQLKQLPNFNYSSTCLHCIIKISKALKTPKYHQLKSSAKTLKALKEQYQQAQKEYQAMRKEYQALDYQEATLKYELTPKPTKQPSTRKSTKKLSAKALALKALENLTPEQRKAILTNL